MYCAIIQAFSPYISAISDADEATTTTASQGATMWSPQSTPSSLLREFLTRLTIQPTASSSHLHTSSWKKSASDDNHIVHIAKPTPQYYKHSPETNTEPATLYQRKAQINIKTEPEVRQSPNTHSETPGGEETVPIGNKPHFEGKHLVVSSYTSAPISKSVVTTTVGPAPIDLAKDKEALTKEVMNYVQNMISRVQEQSKINNEQNKVQEQEKEREKETTVTVTKDIIIPATKEHLGITEPDDKDAHDDFFDNVEQNYYDDNAGVDEYENKKDYAVDEDRFSSEEFVLPWNSRPSSSAAFKGRKKYDKGGVHGMLNANV